MGSIALGAHLLVLLWGEGGAARWLFLAFTLIACETQSPGAGIATVFPLRLLSVS